MECAFENPIVASAKARYCCEDLGVTKMQHATYPKVCEWIARERIKQLRTSKPFGTSGDGSSPCLLVVIIRHVTCVVPHYQPTTN